jgi:predicted dehydrogenase
MPSKKKSSPPKTVRLGIVGLGNMGKIHATNLLAQKVPGAELTAVCDLDSSKLAKYAQLKHFSSSAKMIRSGEIDAILIATPHYDHTTIGIDALQQGLHVLVEKPLSVHKADCERLIAAYKNKKQIFAAMFNQRTDPYYQKVRELVQGGELGTIRRINWIITDWFRTENYYASGGWRATWGGEGGGVLLNQCPHNLDLFQWIFGLPDKVRGFCKIGRYHNIEVEDDVTAYFEYKNGTTGVFITSTGEAPGTNRLEITGERGKLVLENNELNYSRNIVPMSEFCATSTGHFSRPEVWKVQIPSPANHGEQHTGILKNFTNAILNGEKLLAPAPEGIRSVELGNAILMSHFTGQTVDLPLSGLKYEKLLKTLIAKSTFKKKAGPKTVASDFANSFGK